MDKKWKAKWIKALLSGEYKQGQKRLRTQNDNYCCLGVLCDIFSPHEWDEVNKHMRSSGTPSHTVRQTVGLTSSNMWELVSLNDKANYSFQEIATWIDKNL